MSKPKFKNNNKNKRKSPTLTAPQSTTTPSTTTPTTTPTLSPTPAPLNLPTKLAFLGIDSRDKISNPSILEWLDNSNSYLETDLNNLYIGDKVAVNPESNNNNNNNNNNNSNPSNSNPINQVIDSLIIQMQTVLVKPKLLQLPLYKANKLQSPINNPYPADSTLPIILKRETIKITNINNKQSAAPNQVEEATSIHYFSLKPKAK